MNMRNEDKGEPTGADARRDPLGLSALPELEPGFDGWAAVRAGLESRRRGRRQQAMGWMALAATVVLALGLSLRDPVETPTPAAATPGPELASDGQAGDDTLRALITLSQTVESQVRRLREHGGSMSAESSLYVAEIEDLVARVDAELSLQPGSVDLWGQRVNLLLDLEGLYRLEAQRDYHRLASL